MVASINQPSCKVFPLPVIEGNFSFSFSLSFPSRGDNARRTESEGEEGGNIPG